MELRFSAVCNYCEHRESKTVLGVTMPTQLTEQWGFLERYHHKQCQCGECNWRVHVFVDYLPFEQPASFAAC